MVMALPYIVLIALYILQVKRNRVRSRVGFVYVADAMRGQVDLPILLVGQLVLSAKELAISTCESVQATIIANIEGSGEG